MRELGRQTLVATGTTMSVTIPAGVKRILVIVNKIAAAAGANLALTFNSDTGSNYARRSELNGGTHATSVSQANIELELGTNSNNAFAILDIANDYDREKLISGSTVGGSSAASAAPDHAQIYAKWANTTSWITTITITGATNTYAYGSELIVLGLSEDSSLTQFWQRQGRTVL